MKKFRFYYLVLNIIMVVVLVSPLLSYALPPGDETSSSGGGVTSLKNPLEGSGVNSVSDFIGKLLDIVIEFGVPLVALVLVYTGYTFVTSLGDTKKLETAKDMFWWTIIGASLVIGAKAIWAILQGTISSITG